jgi:hypothetical protein
MATLVLPSVPVDTAFPGLTRRRTWAAPDVVSHSLLALTFQKLYLAPAGAAARPETVGAIVKGTDLDAVFGPLGTVVELAKVTRVRFDLLANSLTLVYPQSGGSGSIRSGGNSAEARVIIGFANHEAADELYTKIWRRLGDRVELKPYRRDFWELARLPFSLTLGVLFATVLLAVAANSGADSDTGPLAWLRPVDWRVVCGAGGATLAVLQVWIYRLSTLPPTLLELGCRFPTRRS